MAISFIGASVLQLPAGKQVNSTNTWFQRRIQFTNPTMHVVSHEWLQLPIG